ncbi:glycosyltransferase family 2 protein [uncultured Mitsuokella sp.]|uniref:glycosyltransferase family 2 protein n=1 Tax=uncultured Mitsuokella sp. TaxID=453120 RepID=UPI0025CFB2B3|nr:hypothetical protein [uncultured Mitsuokella sp.]
MTVAVDFFDTPIFIISYNRLDDLKRMVSNLLYDGYKNLIIIDNASSNPQLLNYLKAVDDSRVTIKRLQKNYGHRVLWDSHFFDDIIQNQYYVLTDPDVFPIEGCPKNYIEVFYDILKQYPKKTKVGFSLKIDDLPEDYPYKYDIIPFESFHWERKLPYNFTIYDAPIDTTFALYRPGEIKENNFYDGIRTGGAYIARHQGWYTHSATLNKEYLNDNNVSSTSMNSKAMKNFQIQVIFRLLPKAKPDIIHLMKDIMERTDLKKYSFFRMLGFAGYVIRKKIVSWI